MRAAVVTFFVTGMVSGVALGAGFSRAGSVVDPDVCGLVLSGRATRVLVVLRVGETSDQQQRADAIGRAQDAVVARLPQSHASVVRRYASIPALALEIDAIALRAFETMTDVVAAVKLDRTVMPQ